MKYDFDKVIERRGTDCAKWDDARYASKEVLSMWVADMDLTAPEPVLAALRRAVENGVMGYAHPSERFYKAAADWVKKRHGWAVDPGKIVFSPGVVPAISMAIQALTTPFDGVVIQPPVYYPFVNTIRACKRAVLNNPLILHDGRYEIDFADLEKKLADPRAKMLLLSSPHNPVGRVFTAEELSRMAELCVRYDALIFSDEIHSDLILGERPHVPLASLDPRYGARTLTAIAPSKTFNLAGLQASAVLIENDKIRARFAAELAKNSVGKPNYLGMIGFTAAYEEGEEYLTELLSYLKGNVQYIRDFAPVHLPEIAMHYPEGTYLLWLDCRKLGLSDEALDAFFLNEAKLGLDSGHWFGEEGSGFMRMNLACPLSYVKEAMDRLARAVAALRA